MNVVNVQTGTQPIMMHIACKNQAVQYIYLMAHSTICWLDGIVPSSSWVNEREKKRRKTTKLSASCGLHCF